MREIVYPFRNPFSVYARLLNDFPELLKANLNEFFNSHKPLKKVFESATYNEPLKGLLALNTLS
jgi:hypothetical protein